MFSLLNISPDNVIWFYLAPLLFFGPVFFAVLWNFGLKNIFHTPPEFKEQRRLEGTTHASNIWRPGRPATGWDKRFCTPPSQVCWGCFPLGPDINTRHRDWPRLSSALAIPVSGLKRAANARARNWQSWPPTCAPRWNVRANAGRLLWN